MIKISFSGGTFILYVIIYVIVFLFSLYIVNAMWIYSGPHQMLLYSLITILVSQWIIYPGIFFWVLYRKDRNTLFFMDESTGDIRYHNNNQEMYFNKKDVYEIQKCRPFISTTLSDYSKLRLLSGKEIVVSCFIPINKLFKRHKCKRSYRQVYWINDIIKK
jgi:hypothetical protein